MNALSATSLATLIPRFYLAAMFLFGVYPKLTAKVGFTAILTGFLQNFVLHNAGDAYAGFVRSVVLPNVTVFAPLVIAGELFVGLTLLSGTLTRVAAVVAIFLLTNYMLAKGMAIWMPASNDGADMALALIVLLTGPGRILGIDGILAKRWPSRIW